MKLIGAKKQSRRGEKGAQTSCADSCPSGSKLGSLTLQVPANLNGLNVVVVNGVRFTREGSSKVVIHVAPVMYFGHHFEEVDDLCVKGSRQTAACTKVAELHGFSVEGFSRQYRDRWLNKKMKMSDGIE